MDDDPARANSVQSVDRALDVLEVLATHHRAMGVSELAWLTDLPQGTVHRLLIALLGRGYIRRAAERKYAVGAAALRVADAAHRAMVTTSEPYLRQLVERTDETATLVVMEDAHMVHAAQSPSPHTLRIFATVGHRVAIHATAVGKVALARLGPEEATILLDRVGMPAQTPHTITSTSRMRAELDRVARRGFAVDDEEQELGVRSVAVPVPSTHGPVAALSISGPVERFSLDQAHEVVEEMQRVATAFAAAVFGVDQAPAAAVD